MAGSNAVNTALAHRMRAGVDSTYTRELIESYTFATYGKVIKYSAGRVDVMCGSLKFTNVEVLVLGVNGWGIKPVPAIGDRVLLISSQAPIIDIKTFAAAGSMPPYDVSGLKAIPVCDDLTALQLVTVDKNGVKLTGANKVTINASGVQFEDSNGNKVTTNASGVSFEDLNGNKADTTASGVSFEDLNGNKADATANGVAFEDKSHNKITTTSSGIELEDANHNKVTASSSGIALTDANNNTVTTEQNKITLAVNNGSTIEAGSSSVKINGKLEIKK